MPAPPHITSIDFANRACWRLAGDQGCAVVAQHGGQVLSWIPAGAQEVLWLSPQALPPPGATRGGIPVCWPWFGKHGMPEGAMQHGPVRNRSWRMLGKPCATDGKIVLTLQPEPAKDLDDPLARHAAALELRLRITLDEALTLELTTHNAGATPFVLTQALHTYLAVGDVRRVSIAELAHMRFLDKLTERTHQVHAAPWRFDGPCDRIYQRAPDSATAAHSDAVYTVQDPAAQRAIRLQTQGSGAVVLWNPGAEGAHAIADMPDAAWTQFLCLEAANAGSDVVALAPGQTHTLRQQLTVVPLEATP